MKLHRRFRNWKTRPNTIKFGFYKVCLWANTCVNVYSEKWYGFKTYSHSPLLIDDSIHRRYRNISTYPNNRYDPYQGTNELWRRLKSQSCGPAILVLWQCDLINIHCFSSYFVPFFNKISDIMGPTMKSKASTRTQSSLIRSLRCG
jgi:hypothetical protein